MSACVLLLLLSLLFDRARHQHRHQRDEETERNFGDALLALRSAAEVWKDRAWMAGLGAAASLTACRIDRLNMVCVRVLYETRNVVLLINPNEAIG